VNKTVKKYKDLLPEVGRGQDQLPDLDCDTGRQSRVGEYVLTDQAYARLLDELTKRGLDRVPDDLRRNILAFYAGPSPRKRSGKELKAWRKTLRELDALTWTYVSRELNGGPAATRSGAPGSGPVSRP
jgi:hypothetical protein